MNRSGHNCTCGAPTRRARLITNAGEQMILIDPRPADAGELTVMGWDDPAVVIEQRLDGEPHFHRHHCENP